MSYRALSPDARRLFRRLGLVPGPHYTPEAAGMLVPDSAHLLDVLADAHLIEQPLPGRYRLHDLLRLYAAERARAQETVEDRRAATERLFRWYVHRADAAVDLLQPNLIRLPRARPEQAAFAGGEEALGWLEAERPNIVAAVYAAARDGPRPMTWELADAVRGLLMSGVFRADWLGTLSAGLAAAEKEGDRRAESAMCLGLGFAHSSLGRHDEAIAHGVRARALGEKAGWEDGVAGSIALLGVAHAEHGQLHEAASYFAQALETAERRGNNARVAIHLSNLGGALRGLGELHTAIGHQRRAVALHRAHRSSWGEVLALSTLSATCHDLGRLDEARRHLNRALALVREFDFRFAEADVLTQLAAVHCDAGRYQQAILLAREAVSAATQNPGERVLGQATLARVLARLGNHEESAECAGLAVATARRSRLHYHEAVALLELAAARARRDRAAGALELAARARDLAVAGGYRIIAGQALSRMADLHLACRDHATAVDRPAEAVAIHRETGHRLGEARALYVLGRAYRDAGREPAAIESWTAALRLF